MRVIAEKARAGTLADRCARGAERSAGCGRPRGGSALGIDPSSLPAQRRERGHLTVNSPRRARLCSRACRSRRLHAHSRTALCRGISGAHAQHSPLAPAEVPGIAHASAGPRGARDRARGERAFRHGGTRRRAGGRSGAPTRPARRRRSKSHRARADTGAPASTRRRLHGSRKDACSGMAETVQLDGEPLTVPRIIDEKEL